MVWGFQWPICASSAEERHFKAPGSVQFADRSPGRSRRYGERSGLAGKTGLSKKAPAAGSADEEKARQGK